MLVSDERIKRNNSTCGNTCAVYLRECLTETNQLLKVAITEVIRYLEATPAIEDAGTAFREGRRGKWHWTLT